MKKVIFVISFFMFLYAQNDKYLNYVNKLVNYNFELKNLKDRNSPFEIKIAPEISKQNIQKILLKRIKIDIISIFNNQAYLKIDKFLGEQLIKTEKKWVKKGDKIYTCKVESITLNKVILKCKNRILVKSLDKKIPGFKESK
jgi:hypothetical protein